jgi:Secretion system C-terminal sorting domain
LVKKINFSQGYYKKSIMKKIVFIFMFLHVVSYSQKELWGVNSGYIGSNSEPPFGYPPYFGNIIKYDINGENVQIMHEFDAINGKTPVGRLFMASNDKLYGTTREGGLTSYTNDDGSISNISEGLGTVYEYDLVLNKFRVVKFFSSLNGYGPQIGFIEPNPGILIGASSFSIIKFNYITGLLSTYPGPLGTNYITGNLTKASDGNIYGTTARAFDACPSIGNSNLPYNGTIIKFNPITNVVSSFRFDCDWSKGVSPNGDLVELSLGKLYGTTLYGGSFGISTSNQYSGGVLFEFNILSNTYTKKIDFDNNTGRQPKQIIKATSGKVYGICSAYGPIQECFGNINPTNGTIFEYQPLTNTVSNLYNFNACNNGQLDRGKFLMQASTGDFFGFANTADYNFLFKYNATSGEVTLPLNTSTNFNTIRTNNLIEICRKPSYQEILIDNYTISTGNDFTYNVLNTNATGYQWQQNNINVTGQTTGVLNLVNSTSSNSGVYKCIMTNECGTTVTDPITINVSNLGNNQVEASLEGAIKLFPNPANTIVNIELPKSTDLKIENLKIHNLLGKEVYKVANGSTKIDVSSLAKSIYIVSIKTNYGEWNGKLMKD